MILVLSLLACGADHAKDKAEATVTEAKAVAKKAVGAATEGKVLVVQPGATLRATGAKVIGSHPIDFKDFDGKVVLGKDGVASLGFEVQMKTLTSDNERLTSHLLNEDFFDVEKFPKSSFESTAITKGGAQTSHTVSGNLSVHGQTKSITFPANITVKDGMVEASAEFTVNRQDFGMVYKGKADNLIQDKVAMEIRFTAK